MYFHSLHNIFIASWLLIWYLHSEFFCCYLRYRSDSLMWRFLCLIYSTTICSFFVRLGYKRYKRISILWESFDIFWFILSSYHLFFMNSEHLFCQYEFFVFLYYFIFSTISILIVFANYESCYPCLYIIL